MTDFELEKNTHDISVRSITLSTLTLYIEFII